jgi:two-component system sensor histidine kinase AlgZ
MICPPEPARPEKPRISFRSAAQLFRSAWMILGVAVLVLALLLALGRTRLSHSGTELLSILVYSTLISVPSIFFLTRASERYSSKFPRLVFLLHSLILLATATAGTFAADAILLLTHVNPPGTLWLEFRVSYPFSVVISEAVGLSITSFETMRYKLQAATLELRTRQMEQERAYKLLAEAHLSSLESRIHPHFLFNTLNSIASLIPSDPQRAEDTVGKLASLLRFSLNAHRSGLVPLAQEIKIVGDYLEIEKTRFGDRLRYQISIPQSLESLRVPPLAIQSLVENSVKHVVAQRTQGASIQVVATRDDGRLRLDVIDDGPGFSLEAASPDHGLGNLIARLQLLFGDAGTLQVSRAVDQTKVSLTLPAE